MSGWNKRFWKETSVVEEDGQFAVRLDARHLMTPAKTRFAAPVRGLAERVAAEWDAQEEQIRPETMPFTRLCNAAIDNMPAKVGAVEEMLASYGETDLLCYRAERPDGLIARQADIWDPVLDWAREAHGIRLQLAAGIVPIAQDPAALQRFSDWIGGRDRFTLMALHDLVTLSGSLVLAMAVTERFIDPDAAWQASRLDELWQAEQWGTDAEAEAAAAVKATDFQNAATMMHLLTGAPT